MLEDQQDQDTKSETKKIHFIWVKNIQINKMAHKEVIVTKITSALNLTTEQMTALPNWKHMGNIYYTMSRHTREN